MQYMQISAILNAVYAFHGFMDLCFSFMLSCICLSTVIVQEKVSDPLDVPGFLHELFIFYSSKFYYNHDNRQTQTV